MEWQSEAQLVRVHFNAVDDNRGLHFGWESRNEAKGLQFEKLASLAENRCYLEPFPVYFEEAVHRSHEDSLMLGGDWTESEGAEPDCEGENNNKADVIYLFFSFAAFGRMMSPE